MANSAEFNGAGFDPTLIDSPRRIVEEFWRHPDIADITDVKPTLLYRTTDVPLNSELLLETSWDGKDRETVVFRRSVAPELEPEFEYGEAGWDLLRPNGETEPIIIHGSSLPGDPGCDKAMVMRGLSVCYQVFATFRHIDYEKDRPLLCVPKAYVDCPDELPVPESLPASELAEYLQGGIIRTDQRTGLYWRLPATVHYTPLVRSAVVIEGFTTDDAA